MKLPTEEITINEGTNQPLTAQEKDELKQLKEKITAGAKAWLVLAESAVQIRDRRLYREEASTFEEFCQKNWGWTRGRINQLIRGAETVKSLPEGMDTSGIQTERAARELAVPSGNRAAVLTKASTLGGPVTAKAIVEASKPDVELDREGYPIPADLVSLWNRRGEMQELITGINRIMSVLKAVRRDDPLWGTLHVQEVGLLLDKARALLSRYKPYVVCLLCQGHPESQQNKQCPGCKGTGFIGRYMWNSMDANLKAVRQKMCKMQM